MYMSLQLESCDFLKLSAFSKAMQTFLQASFYAIFGNLRTYQFKQVIIFNLNDLYGQFNAILHTFLYLQ